MWISESDATGYCVIKDMLRDLHTPSALTHAVCARAPLLSLLHFMWSALCAQRGLVRRVDPGRQVSHVLHRHGRSNCVCVCVRARTCGSCLCFRTSCCFLLFRLWCISVLFLMYLQHSLCISCHSDVPLWCSCVSFIQSLYLVCVSTVLCVFRGRGLSLCVLAERAMSRVSPSTPCFSGRPSWSV